MICPNCKAEYRDGYYVCKDCGVDLVPELLPQSESRRAPRMIEYAPLMSVGSRLMYEMIGAHLDAAGIEYIPRRSVLARLELPFPLEVRRDQVGIALDLLSELDLSLCDPYRTEEVPAPEGQRDAAADVLPPAAQAVPAFGAAVEVAVAREGRYLCRVEAASGDDSLSLPGGPLPPDGKAEETLENAVQQILAAEYGLAIGRELLYVTSSLDRDRTGGTWLRILFLARWQGGEPSGTARWIYAADLARLPGAPPALRAAVEKADALRLAKRW